jgi:uncharacterized protein (TIGR02145 family)
MEWTILINNLGGESVAGKKMKSTNGWKENGNGTNESDFSGVPGGSRDHVGAFSAIGKNGTSWSSTETNTFNAWYRYLDYGNGNVYRGYGSKEQGFSVRCLRD